LTLDEPALMDRINSDILNSRRCFYDSYLRTTVVRFSNDV
jgi:hypothetical protein